MDVPGITKKVLEVSGLTQSQLAAKVGVSQGTISKWMKDDHSPNLDQWERLVSFAKRFPELRNTVKGSASTQVSVMGYIGAGSEISPEYEQVPVEGLEDIAVPFPVPDGVIAFKVVGDSMRPAYREGDVVLVYEDRRLDIERYYGEDIAVRLADGRRYIKEVQPGQRKGRFTLYSHNGGTISDVQIEWCGEVHSVVRARQVRNIRRPSPKKARG